MTSRRLGAGLLLLLAALAPLAGRAAEPDWAGLRARMLAAIESEARATARWIGKTGFDRRVMKAMARVPRHEFVPEAFKSAAYADRALPIGHGQTISQPYIVALMSDLAGVGPGARVFELGTGSGYQAAVLAEMGAEVYTMEIIPELATRAAARLRRLGYASVHVSAGDGYYGAPAHAPFDAVLVTAAASHVPPPLIDQLKPGGRLIIPLGTPFFTQQLVLIEKRADGTTVSRQILPVMFVPLTGGH